ncbi:hypothetical protein FB440_1362 [Vibrio crassostreae]|uniref:hypothetical protein n=1 Tax=Vibrio TaxID=662 RepID=UPI00119A34CB|nr:MULTISPECIES: hypothetical protein [Vibrio]CAH7215439.1 conserved membrane hypothetical protein [Vibrio chagasii]MCC4791022.1 hypothetical protein [Vibrio splendidus]TWD31206.1 hypothetical protein FB440_1362 [Vibrio crassostreae]CAH7244819.1 conserved membrane hypothetical protein [Vibrio chagasii]CAH7301210.1 conserved membrane hypothetical protein [Vibrio chagasii]
MNEVALLLGMLGTGMLALDVASPHILSELSNNFRSFTKDSTFPKFIFYKNYEPTRKDRESLHRIVVIGMFSIFFSLAAGLVLFPELNDVLDSYLWVVSIPFLLFLLGYWSLSFSEKLGGLIITGSTMMILPFFYLFFIVFGTLGTIIGTILSPIVSLENSIIGKDQSPRLLGLLILFLSFFIQLVAFDG